MPHVGDNLAVQNLQNVFNKQLESNKMLFNQ